MAESPATSSYPGTIDSWVTLVDKEDLAEVSDIMKLKDAVEAIQTELGTNPAGSKTDLVARLAVLMEDNGAINQGTSYPGSPVDGQFFYRTDLNTAAFYNGSSWDSLGQSLSNLIYCWSGFITDNTGLSGGRGFHVGSDLTASGISTGQNFSYMTALNNTYCTVLEFQYRHIAGISDIEIHALLWSSANTADCQVTIGGQSNNVTRASTTPDWATSADIDVSGLVVDTVYDGKIEIKNSNSGQRASLGSIILIAK